MEKAQEFKISMTIRTSQPQTETFVERQIYELINDETTFRDIEIQNVEKLETSRRNKMSKLLNLRNFLINNWPEKNYPKPSSSGSEATKHNLSHAEITGYNLARVDFHRLLLQFEASEA